MDQTFMKERKVLPLVLSMSLPMILSMAVSALYNIIDSYFVAGISEDAMTALSLVYPMQNLVSAVAIGFGIGINAAIAFYLGEHKQVRADTAATLGLFFGFLHGILLTVICMMAMPSFLRLFTSDETIIRLALSYAYRVLLFAVVIQIEIVFEKLFQAVGMMKVTMFSVMCGCVINILLDPILIYGAGPFPAMGIAGAAYATDIGHCLSLVIYLLFFIRLHPPLHIRRRALCFDKTLVRRLYTVGISASLNLALPSLQVSALNSILSSFSDKYVLVLGVYYKLQTFIYLTSNGIIQGIRPLMAYNYGAGETNRVKKIYRTTLSLTAGVMLVGTVLSWCIPDRLIGLFTSNTETVTIGVNALHIISLGFLVSAVSVTSSGALEGLGKGAPSFVISLLRYLVLMVPAACILSRFIGVSGVWYAFCLTEFVCAVFSLCIYLRSSRASGAGKSSR